jgi:hypothetical protein
MLAVAAPVVALVCVLQQHPCFPLLDFNGHRYNGAAVTCLTSCRVTLVLLLHLLLLLLLLLLPQLLLQLPLLVLTLDTVTAIDTAVAIHCS